MPAVNSSNCSLSRRCVTGLSLAFLVLSLSACAALPGVKAPTAKPPPNLLVETPTPEFVGETNGDLLEYVEELKDALGQCNANVKAIEEWTRN